MSLYSKGLRLIFPLPNKIFHLCSQIFPSLKIWFALFWREKFAHEEKFYFVKGGCYAQYLKMPNRKKGAKEIIYNRQEVELYFLQRKDHLYNFQF
jgi:hypothetical protein